ncbi:MAG: hypothetical protein P8N43_07695, partial [Alphaproteobacteria bacterium]|nr:hypothetical protein [Alphaproteobacteria bacterium]
EEYQHFVTGGGPVARAFGPFEPPMFSMELSARIESGRSWHLAAFIAHGLAAENRLAGREETPEAVVWATGVMGNDFSVTAEHVAIKFEQSRSLFEETRAAGLDLHVVAPVGSLDDADEESPATIHQVGDARAALETLNITIGQAGNSGDQIPTSGEAKERPVRVKRWRTWVIGGASALALAMVAEIAADWVMTEMRDLSVDEAATKSTTPVTPAKIAEEPVTQTASTVTNTAIQLDEIRASSETSCAAVHFGTAPGTLMPVRVNGNAAAGDSASGGLCGMRISLPAMKLSSVELVSIELTSGGFVGQRDTTFNLGPVSKGSWDLFVPQTLKVPIVYVVRLVRRTGSDVSISHRIEP